MQRAIPLCRGDLISCHLERKSRRQSVFPVAYHRGAPCVVGSRSKRWRWSRGTLARVRLVLAVALVLLPGGDVHPQQQTSSDDEPRAKAALAAVRGSETQTIADQVRLCEVPAPPFGERARAMVFRDMLIAAGLRGARIDREGNVVAERPGRMPRPTVVFAAHLDTVFPDGTPVKVRRDGVMLRGPGIGDNCRGLAVLAAVARALNSAAVETEGAIIFAGTVGEEGLGDLRGVKALLRETLKGRADRFVAVDGTGGSITNIGVGSRRHRFTFRGSGGHSYTNFGRANPASALGRAVARIAELRVPASPKTTFNVGRIGGGTSVNAIPEEAWMEVDMRSTDEAALDALERSVQKIVAESVQAENDRWKKNGLITVSAEQVGDRPAGRTDQRSPIVQTALAVSKSLGLRATLQDSSTDANVAMQMGIPAIAIGAGGTGSGAHSLTESFNSTNSVRGTARVLQLALALSRR